MPCSATSWPSVNARSNARGFGTGIGYSGRSSPGSPTDGDWLYIAKPRTVIQWQRRRVREYWTRLSQPRRRGRPELDPTIAALIRRISTANVLWGAPRIVGELKMLGIEIAESTVAKYMVKRPRPASPTWSAFLHTHLCDMISVDFFIVPTIRRQILFVFLGA